jgi:aryl-alcohol dehydrogenase-like predicted oxidoreductase
MKLGLGTAQFGMNYGISNVLGQPSLNEMDAILKMASEQHIQYIDTAAVYGESEKNLGAILPANHTFKIITKIPALSKSHLSIDESFKLSLQRLNQTTMYGALIHDADDLFSVDGKKNFCALQNIKKAGLVKKIGVSVYTTRQIENILNSYEIDLIQLPINVFDQRLLENNLLKNIKQKNIEIHARSAFLQGLLLIPPEHLDPYFDGVKTHIKNYHAWLTEDQLTPLQAALGFVLGIDEIDVVIVGVNSQHELATNIQSSIALDKNRFKSFALHEESVLNPSLWKLTSRITL